MPEAITLRRFVTSTEKIDELSIDQGHHVRLKYGARAEESVEDAPKRHAKKRAAKKKAAKKRAAKKKAAKRKKS